MASSCGRGGGNSANSKSVLAVDERIAFRQVHERGQPRLASSGPSRHSAILSHADQLYGSARTELTSVSSAARRKSLLSGEAVVGSLVREGKA